MNYQKIGKDLMSQDEIAVMDGGKCIMQLRGVRPFFQINMILQSMSSTNIYPIMMRKIPLMLKST